MTSDEFASSLDEGYPQSWRPEKDDGDSPNPLIGTFVEMTSATTAYGPCWVMVVELDDKTRRSVWLIHTVLRNELSRVRPEPGERIGVKYLGKQGEGATGYIGYRVKVDRPQGKAFDWDKMGAQPEPDPDLPDVPVMDEPPHDDDAPF
jgi:hypothetical protein